MAVSSTRSGILDSSSDEEGMSNPSDVEDSEYYTDMTDEISSKVMAAFESDEAWPPPKALYEVMPNPSK